MKALTQGDLLLIAGVKKKIIDVFYHMILAENIVLIKYNFCLESVLNNDRY